MTYPPIKIADYFLYKYRDNGINPMKLNKLVYISHGWFLAVYNNPLLTENPEAWKYGPVIPSLYEIFKDYGVDNIPKGEQYEVLDRNVERVLDKIWEVYGKFSDIELSSITNKIDSPWSVIWNELKNKNRTSLQITHDVLYEHYRKKLLFNVEHSY